MTHKSKVFRIVHTLHDAEIPQPPPKMATKIREKDIFEGVSEKKKSKNKRGKRVKKPSHKSSK